MVGGEAGGGFEGGVRGAGEGDLDVGDRHALRLQPLDGHELQQVTAPVPGDPAAPGQGRVDQPDRGVPPDEPLARHLADPAVERSRVRAQRVGRALRQLADGPGVAHVLTVTLSQLQCQGEFG
jgi:hypothetical protein